MDLSQVSILVCFLITLTAGSNDNPTHFTGDVSINCGSAGTFAARNGREWLGDIQPKHSSLLRLKGSSTASTAIIHGLTSAADPVPHNTARLSLSQFSYSLQVNPGQKIIRLHFNPTTYKGFKGLKDLFTVEAGPFTLLSNFSASLTADALGVNTFAKEFCLNIQENQHLSITFSPESSQSLDTYAFVNGIEIISVPASLSYFHDGDNELPMVGQKSLVYVDSNTALEIVQRLNIKQDLVPPNGDLDDMFPKWAMQKVDKMKSKTWKIPVEVGFRYLVRLHFSEVGLKLAATGDMTFKVLINQMIAHTNSEILKARDENNILLYRDYMVMMRGLKKNGKRDLLISLQSYDELRDGHGVLAGFEVVKLSNPDNSLAGPNPLPPPQDSPTRTIRILLSALGYRNATAAVAITIMSLLCIIVHKLRETWEASNTEEEHKLSARAERLCRRFSLAEIQLATRNFNDGLLIGRGGFGKVYKGLIDKGQKTVAVKRLKPNSQQGAHEFLTEVETLSELRHINLVSLIGYCSERREMILVYEYMPNGTLADHLYKLARHGGNSSSLSWKQRLNICIGAGRGLDYLHTGHRVIHRDIKASNILLDEDFTAKVSDFGLAKPEKDGSKLLSHVSTKVKGTRGYLDAHYINTSKLTRKSDIYAFGVVLLEVLCGRAALDFGVSEDERLLSRWARDKISEGEVDQIVALSLRKEISPNSLKTFVGVAERCLDEEPKNRPTMSQVVIQLESALEQQDSKQPLVSSKTTSAASDEIEQSVSTGQPTVASTDVQNLVHPPPEQTNGKLKMASTNVQNLTHPPEDSKLVNTELQSRKYVGRKAATDKQSRLWSWLAFWNRANLSKENELLLSEIRKARVNLVKFDWDTLATATDEFSASYKVGQGGFGSVYKAVLPTGQLVVVKRRSTSSCQVLKEFKNEILSLSQFQHQNIIKLLGYCIHGDETLLVHEFMENRNLATFIDKEQGKHLPWAVRFKIIKGIARGLVYLHQAYGLTVIHRDIKPSNILLGSGMTPKISDFGLARALVEHQSELETSRIIGTYGYLAPEYSLWGRFSVKSDAYSFGMVVLEIVSGRGVRNPEYSMGVHQHAWNLWTEGKALNLVDDSLADAFPADEALKCIQVGLLCIEKEPSHRPTMPSVLKMLEGDEPLVEPQDPWPGPRQDSAHSDGY